MLLHNAVGVPVLLVPVIPGLREIAHILSLIAAGESFVFTLLAQFMPVYIGARMRSFKMPEGSCRDFVRSRLDGINLSGLQNRVTLLLEKQEIYLDDKLNLDTFAQKAGYSSKVISEFLNSVKKTRFTDLVNEYRMKKAIELLKNNPDLSVTHAAMDAGFNSIPTFYRLFKKETGTSPEKYRSM